MSGRRRVYLCISGNVQGVGFRYHMRQQARLLGLAGWVRNRPDGLVEAEAEGHIEGVQRLIDWARKGPSMARVDRVEIQALAARGDEQNFQIVD